MVGTFSPVHGAQPIEYGEETDYAAELPDTQEWNWFGITTSWDVDQGVESSSITYLPEFDSSNKLEKRTNVKLREMYEGSVTFHPQSDFTLLEYFTGAANATADDVTSLQIGEIDEDNDEYRRLLGAVGEEITISVGEDEVAEVEGSFIMGDATDWTSTDYVGVDGSHAAEDTTEPWAYKNLSNVQYGGTDFSGAIDSVELTISNDLAVVRDPSSSLSTQIVSIVPVDREITVDVEFTYDDFSMLSDIRSYSDQDFVFDIGNTTFTVNGVKFPELPFEFTPDDLVSDSITSDPADGFSWSTTSP
jgi:hypothetical protein